MVHTSTSRFACAFNYTQTLHIHCISSLIIHCHPGSLHKPNHCSRMTRSSKYKQIPCRSGLERYCRVTKQASIICHRVLHRRYEWRSTLWQQNL